MMMMKFLIFCLLFVSNIQVAARNQIRFGSTQSALALDSGATFLGRVQQQNVDSGTINNMIIEQGGFTGKEGSAFLGTPIQFKNGVLTVGESISNLDGILDPQKSIINLVDNALAQPGGTLISNPGGLYTLTTVSKPGFNFLRGQPLFNRPVPGHPAPQPNAITLHNQNTILSLGIQNTLNTNIILNGGSIVLEDDLRMGDLGILKGGNAGFGGVVFNNRKLSLGGIAADWNDTIVWNSANDLQLNSAVTLNGIWAFIGTSQINGNGNVIDLSNGGRLYVLANPFSSEPSILRLAGVNIKGLGSGSILLGNVPGQTLDTGAQLILTDCVIEMDDSYDFTCGTVIIEGNTGIITRDNFLSFVDSPDGTTHGHLTVESVSLTYDTQWMFDQNNIRPNLIQDPTGKYVTVLGGGEIRTFKEDSLTFRNYQTSGLLQKYAIVANYRPFHVLPTPIDTGGFDFNVTVDGNTNFLGFTRDDTPVFFVVDGVQATMTNVVMRDLSTKHISLGVGSSLIFGDKTTILLARNEVLNTTWTFSGETIFKGAGNILTLGPNGAIQLIGEGSSLLFAGITIEGINGTNISCTDDSSTISLQGVKWVQSGDFNYPTGSFQILDDTTMMGPYNFTFSSTQLFAIQSAATLSWVRNMIFNYAPTDGNMTSFQFAGPTAALFMDEATFNAPTGVLLDTGLLVVRDYNFASGLTFGPNLTVDQPSSAVLASS